MLSYLSRVNYDFDNKYYFSSSIRRDGSSRLGVNERWANFWSLSGAWRLTQEHFMDNLTFMDDLKVRVSYGTSGTLPGGYYDHLALYSYTGAYDEAGAAVEDQIASPNLTWEKNKNFNIGFEFGVFKRIRGSFEYFQRHTSDLLMNLPLAPTIGAGSTMVNIGEMENKGFEFEIRTDNFSSKDLNWSSTILFTSTKNKILKLNNGEEMIGNPYIQREGLPYYSFYLPIWAGVDPADGSPMWYVVDENENITDEITHDSQEADRAIAGSAEPDFYGSIGNNISYKGFNLSFIFNFSVGGKVWYASGYKSWNDGRSPKYVVPEGQVDRWQNPGDIAAHPKRIWNGNNNSDIYSTRFLLDNDFLRLKDITLSYAIPESLLKKLFINSANVYVQGRNLLTFASQDVVDPEHGGASGYAYFEIPPMKTITFGVEIGF
jgi:TonB-linked SusC/RagA family outer membrane protein